MTRSSPLETSLPCFTRGLILCCSVIVLGSLDAIPAMAQPREIPTQVPQALGQPLVTPALRQQLVPSAMANQPQPDLHLDAATKPLAESRPAVSPVDISSAFQIGNIAGLSGNLLFGATIEGTDRIFVLDFDARRIRRVIEGPGNSSYPSWSPDGRHFAFVSDRDGNREIYAAEWDGRSPVRLTTNPGNDENPSWSKDGSKIAFVSEVGKPGGDANVMAISVGDSPGPSSSIAPLTKLSGRQTVPKISPDGKMVSYSTNRFWPGWDVCTSSIHTKQEKCLLSGAQTYCRQDYSPDGRNIVFSFGAFDAIDLGILELDSGKRTTLTSMPRREYDAIWSPDGKLIAFTAEDGRTDIYNVYLIAPGEKAARPVISSAYSLRFLSWTKARTLELEAERQREEG